MDFSGSWFSLLVAGSSEASFPAGVRCALGAGPPPYPAQQPHPAGVGRAPDYPE